MAQAKHIRQARLTDINAIYDLIREHPKEVLPRSFHDITAHFDRFYVYDDGEVRGVISWQVLPSIEPENREFSVEIISFFVKAIFSNRFSEQIFKRIFNMTNFNTILRTLWTR